MLITDQVATAPCTDCVQARHPTFEALQTGLAQKVQIHESERQRRGI